MKKVLALVLSLVLMLGGNAVALAENEQSLPPLNEISSIPIPLRLHGARMYQPRMLKRRRSASPEQVFRS